MAGVMLAMLAGAAPPGAPAMWAITFGAVAVTALALGTRAYIDFGVRCAVTVTNARCAVLCAAMAYLLAGAGAGAGHAAAGSMPGMRSSAGGGWALSLLAISALVALTVVMDGCRLARPAVGAAHGPIVGAAKLAMSGAMLAMLVLA